MKNLKPLDRRTDQIVIHLYLGFIEMIALTRCKSNVIVKFDLSWYKWKYKKFHFISFEKSERGDEVVLRLLSQKYLRTDKLQLYFKLPPVSLSRVVVIEIKV